MSRCVALCRVMSHRVVVSCHVVSCLVFQKVPSLSLTSEFVPYHVMRILHGRHGIWIVCENFGMRITKFRAENVTLSSTSSRAVISGGLFRLLCDSSHVCITHECGTCRHCITPSPANSRPICKHTWIHEWERRKWDSWLRNEGVCVYLCLGHFCYIDWERETVLRSTGWTVVQCLLTNV